MKWILYFSIMCFSCLTAGSIKLFNDTIYPLTAQVYAANGQMLGQVLIKPNEVKTWSNYSSSNAKKSETPYRVVWHCSNSDQSSFSVIDYIGSGSTVTAMQGSGSRTCPSDKKDKNSSEKNSK